MMKLEDGCILDYISNTQIRETPEERDAVQVFSRMLVEDYGYPKENIQTHPQWRIKARPSDEKKEYPVDIAVFESETHTDNNVHIIVECKKKNRKDGKSQLKDYLRFSIARIGVWFNGDERLFLKKTEKKGKVFFEEIPNIPRYRQRLEDVGLFKRKDLTKATNLKVIFKAIRHYLAATAVGITRDEIFAQQMIYLIFCKIYDERFTKPEEIVTFRAGIDEKPRLVKKRILDLFDSVKAQYSDVLEDNDSIILDEKSLTYVVGELTQYALKESSRDAVGEAFEIFIGPSLKGPQGQFFTPRNVVKMIVDIIDPMPNHKIIDPACGSGGFLVEALRHVWNKVELRGKELNWPETEIEAEKQKVAIKNFRGIDKDTFLSKVAKAYMAILGDGRGGVYCENSLELPKNWNNQTQDNISLNNFDVVITNPPFGKKLAIDSTEILEEYKLGHKWKEENGTFLELGVQDKQPPQLLFVERCLALLKPGGKLGIVLLESIFGMPKYQYVVNFLQNNTKILAIITMPEDLFQPNTHAKCCVVICEKRITNEPYSIFMCDVKWCGHDSRGNPTYRYDENGEKILLDDIPNVAQLYHKGKE